VIFPRKRHGIFIRSLIEAGQVSAVHDLSDGGLLVAIGEMALAGRIGASSIHPLTACPSMPISSGGSGALCCDRRGRGPAGSFGGRGESRRAGAANRSDGREDLALPGSLWRSPPQRGHEAGSQALYEGVATMAMQHPRLKSSFRAAFPDAEVDD